jgi:hypothetical protein
MNGVASFCSQPPPRAIGRGLVRAECAIQGALGDVWRRLLSAPGWLTRGSLDLAEGERFEVVTASGEPLSGRVLQCVKPVALACALDRPKGGFLRLGIGRWPSDEGDRVRLWLVSSQLDDRWRDRLQEEWQRTMEELFFPSLGATAERPA